MHAAERFFVTLAKTLAVPLVVSTNIRPITQIKVHMILSTQIMMGSYVHRKVTNSEQCCCSGAVKKDQLRRSNKGVLLDEGLFLVVWRGGGTKVSSKHMHGMWLSPACLW